MDASGGHPPDAGRPVGNPVGEVSASRARSRENRSSSRSSSSSRSRSRSRSRSPQRRRYSRSRSRSSTPHGLGSHAGPRNVPAGKGKGRASHRAPPPRDNKIFVAGLQFDVDNDELARVFQRFGKVEEAKVIYNHETNKSRGFGFVKFVAEDAHAAQDAIDEMNQTTHDGRECKFCAVRFACVPLLIGSRHLRSMSHDRISHSLISTHDGSLQGACLSKLQWSRSPENRRDEMTAPMISDLTTVWTPKVRAPNKAKMTDASPSLRGRGSRQFDCFDD
eukprot:SAG31_NODE_2162_length_6294_cov_4.696691_2_plen_277_part_00